MDLNRSICALGLLIQPIHHEFTNGSHKRICPSPTNPIFLFFYYILLAQVNLVHPNFLQKWNGFAGTRLPHERFKSITEPSIRIPLRHVQRKNTGTETMLYNLAKSIKVNDILDIDYTAGVTNKQPINALSERFCDNIIFHYPSFSIWYPSILLISWITYQSSWRNIQIRLSVCLSLMALTLTRGI